jgi:hypothetical protein
LLAGEIAEITGHPLERVGEMLKPPVVVPERPPSEAGEIAELERVAKPDPELVGIVGDYLRRYPNLRRENKRYQASWVKAAIWAEVESIPAPTLEAVEVALTELAAKRASQAPIVNSRKGVAA